MKFWTTALLFLSLSTPLLADGDTAGQWDAAHRSLANALSNVAVDSQIGVNLYLAVKDHPTARWKAVGCEALKLGIAQGATESLKRIVHRERPDGSDTLSFPSGHTASAFAMSGWTWQASVPLAAFVGWQRVAAAKHHWSDVAAGAGIGLLSRWAVGRWGACVL